MYEQIETGPLYDKVVRSMSTYRSVAARMQNTKANTQGKLDRRLESLAEKIGENLGELTDEERMALTCWKYGIMAGAYEVDHDEITSKPYVSLRKVDRWDEEYDVAEMKASMQADDERDDTQKKADAAKLRAFLSMTDDT